MSDTFEFELVSPAKLLKSEPASFVVVPLAEGDIGVLPGHSPLIGTIRPGTIDIHEGGKVAERVFVTGGVCEVSPDRLTVLADEATMVADIDRTAAEASVTEARNALQSADDADRADLERALATAEARVSAAQKAA